MPVGDSQTGLVGPLSVCLSTRSYLSSPFWGGVHFGFVSTQFVISVSEFAFKDGAMRNGLSLLWLRVSRGLAPATPESPQPAKEGANDQRLSPRPIRWKRVALGLSILGGCLICWGCRSTPVSGRKQLVLVPEAQEMQLGVTAYQDVLKKEPPSKNEKYVSLVKRVGQRIAAVAGRDDFEWEFNVIKSDTQNAFCLPGGKVAVYEGIIPVCESEAGLAVVMSHEIAHALARHGGERMTQQSIKQAGGKLIEFAAKEQEESKQKLVLTAYGAASEYGVILPFSRKHESEADMIGLKLMAEAGYDPSEAPRFWERFASAKGGKEQPEWLSTHPSDARRAAELRAALPDAVQTYEKAGQKFGLGERIVTLDSRNVTEPPMTALR